MPARAGKRGKAKRNPYVKDENPELRKVTQALRNFVKGIVPGVKETVNAWGVPTFEVPDPFCFYMTGKNHVTFGLHFATSLPDPQGLLEGTGKNIRHVKLRSVRELEQKGLQELVLAAARLKGKAPMKWMSGQKKRG
jgi:hypothetical protein